MPFHKDFHFKVEGNVVAFSKSSGSRAASLPPGQGLKFPFTAIEGGIGVSVSALNFREPKRSRLGPVDPSTNRPTTIDEFNNVPVTIELIPPGQTKPVFIGKTDGGFSEEDLFVFNHSVGESTSKPGVWHCLITNKGKVAATVVVKVGSVFDRQPLQTAELPLQLIDHAYQLILEALTPSANIVGKTVFISFGAELVKFFGNTGGVLGPHNITLPPGVEATGALQKFNIKARSGKNLLEAMVARWQSKKTSFEEALDRAKAIGGVGSFAVIKSLQDSLEANDKWRSDYEQKVKPDFAAIHAQVGFSDIVIEKDVDLFVTDIEVTIAEIEDALVNIHLAFDPQLLRGHCLIITPAKLTGGLADIAERFGLISPLNELIENKLTELVDNASPLLARYLGEALARLSARDAVFMKLTANDSAWRVQYTPIPKEHNFGGTVGGTVVTGPIGGGVVSAGGGGGGTQSQPTGEIPPEFIVRSPDTLARLDQIQTIVVVMMENRSFDHMLGFLKTSRGPKYEGLTLSESNNVSGRVKPVRINKASNVVPAPVTRILGGPGHGSEDTKFQINAGEMSRFAQDYENRFPGKAETVMTFYTDKELTTYYKLATDFKICDHWFASHPGPTWPNRWCTFSGTAFSLKNLDIDDPDIGFINETTIFDLLDSKGIDWRIFESDLSLIRTYNRYRLNTRNVVPLINLHDRNQDFFEVAKRGELPPVVFVEPNFSDLPPLSSANDDLVPVDLRRGQNFVNEIYKALLASSQWNNTLLVVTYDEHGGFYDHVPPPGTPLGPPEFIGKIAKIHKDQVEGTVHLGVRVPAILVSPRVNPGEVSKEVFDHTSIIKTILLRHRAKFTKSELTQFGPRVNEANHLALALDLLTARTAKPKPLRRISLKKAKPERIGNTPDVARRPVGSDDFHEALRRGFLPRRG